MEDTLVLFTPFIIGYAIGLLQHGIRVNINHKVKEKEIETPTEYNNSFVDEMPEEIRNYYDQTQGMNKF